jgi:MFS family permease
VSIPHQRDLLLINSAAFLRSVGTGLMGVVLGVYLSRSGFSSFEIGLVLAAGLAGSSVATFAASFRADRFGRRRTLVVLSALLSVAGIALAFVHRPGLLLPLVFVGMLNGAGTDRSAVFAIDQAILPGLVTEDRRTWTLSWYNVLLDTGGALGALSAVLPELLRQRFAVNSAIADSTVFLIFAGLGIASALLYLGLSRSTEVLAVPEALQPVPVSPKSKRVVARLATLFALDSFGGGFLTDALVAYWFFRRFGMAEHQLGLLFFGVHILNAFSHVGAAWLAKRIGLVNTMVFTHLPSSLLLIAVPFAASLKIAMTLFLLRESLVEMDVPARQSYVAAVVTPQERTYASGITNLTRNVFWAVGSGVAGLFMQEVAFSAPLVIGGGVKIAYDLLLYRGFRPQKSTQEAPPPQVNEHRSVVP